MRDESSRDEYVYGTVMLVEESMEYVHECVVGLTETVVYVHGMVGDVSWGDWRMFMGFQKRVVQDTSENVNGDDV